jgi:hypothetical protein
MGGLQQVKEPTMETMHLVELADERGNPIYFVDWRDVFGVLVDSRFFPTKVAALTYMLTDEWED